MKPAQKINSFNARVAGIVDAADSAAEAGQLLIHRISEGQYGRAMPQIIKKNFSFVV